MKFVIRARRPTPEHAWPVWSAPRRLLALAAVSELVAVGLVIIAFRAQAFTGHSLALCGFVVVMSIASEALMERASRVRIRLGMLSAEVQQDMQAVWGVAVALALPRASAAVVVIVLFGFTWYRQQRPAGQQLYRELFNGANAVISCLTAGWLFQSTADHLAPGSWAVSTSAAAALAIVTFTVVNRTIASCALIALGLSARATLGNRDENLIDLATLCLGALLAVAIANAPFVAILVFAPMIALQRGAAVRALETAATTDSKTGLLNAVAWEEIASKELSRAAREGNEISVLIIDIDHFKRVNDRYGHLVGDLALRRLARTLSAEVREYDTVARFGGEEFVVVLPSASSEDAVMIAERLRARVHELRMSTVVENLEAGGDERLAVSIGVATAPSDGVELPDLLHAADGALYRAKAEGRNRVEVAGDDRGNQIRLLPSA